MRDHPAKQEGENEGTCGLWVHREKAIPEVVGVDIWDNEINQRKDPTPLTERVGESKNMN